MYCKTECGTPMKSREMADYDKNIKIAVKLVQAFKCFTPSFQLCCCYSLPFFPHNITVADGCSTLHCNRAKLVVLIFHEVAILLLFVTAATSLHLQKTSWLLDLLKCFLPFWFKASWLLLLLKAFSFPVISTVLFHVADADATAWQQPVDYCFSFFIPCCCHFAAWYG